MHKENDVVWMTKDELRALARPRFRLLWLVLCSFGGLMAAQLIAWLVR